MAAKQGKGLSHFFSKDKTFKPKKKFKEGTLRYDLHKQAKATLHSGISLQDCVKLPPGEDPNDWVAVHVVDFFNRINLIYGTVFEYCTPESCPSMTGGQRYEYFWCDGDKYKKPTAVPAREYIALLMDWTENLINNEDVFPVDKDIPFPKVFLPSAKKILTRLFRVFVHVYIHHFTKIQDMQAEAHVNQCYKHYYYFISEFKLVDPKELEPLKTLTERLCPAM